MSRLIACPKCNSHVNSVLLRSEFPRCENGHELGSWFICGNPSENHVFLALEGAKCPYCGNSSKGKMSEGMKVKCQYETSEGAKCNARPYLWIKEGPPCFMNHVSKLRLEI
ncbi:MAG: hypothetical protein JRN20_20240 [Nitrososphaerota archaeon]|nr:hypothetical protein [Nitrososphaerota archaeon]